MSHARSRALRGGLTAALAAAAALGASAVPAMAGPTVTLKYLCEYPLVQEQPLSIVIKSDIPSTSVSGQPTNAFHINTVATAGGTTVTGLNLVGATSVEGVATAGAQLTGEANIPVTVPITVNKYTLPAGQTSGDLVLSANGTTPALTLNKGLTNVIKLSSLSLNLIARKSDGTPVTGLSAAQTVPASDTDPNTFDVTCRLDPAAGTQNTTIGTILVKSNPDKTAPSAPTGLTASATTSKQTTLKWTASTDNVGVTGYDVFEQGIRVASTTGATTLTVPNLGSLQNHAFELKARDGAGLLSEPAKITVYTGGETTVSGTPDPTPIAPVTIGYACKYPLIGYQLLSVKITTNIPKSSRAGVETPAYTINAVATVPASTYAALGLVGVKSIEGTAKADSHVSAPGLTLPVTVPITLTKKTVPATAGAFDLVATGSTPPLTFPKPGTAKVVVDTLRLNLTARRADNGVIPLPSAGTDSDGIWSTFDVKCKLNPLTQSGLIGITTLLKP